MINHSLSDNLVHLSINKKDFLHRIPLDKIGKVIQWNVGEKGSENIVVKNVSKWTLRLFTRKFTDVKYIDAFQRIVQEYAPKNNIDWNATYMAVSIQNEYNSRIAQQSTAANKMTAEEIVLLLEEKYGLD